MTDVKHPRVRTIYVTGPLTNRQNPDRWADVIGLIASKYPTSRLIDSLNEYDGLADWQRRWPRIVRGIDLLVFVSHPDDTLGAGTVKEIMDATVNRIAVRRLVHDVLVPAHFFNMQLIRRPTPRRAVRLATIG